MVYTTPYYIYSYLLLLTGSDSELTGELVNGIIPPLEVSVIPRLRVPRDPASRLGGGNSQVPASW